MLEATPAWVAISRAFLDSEEGLTYAEIDSTLAGINCEIPVSKVIDILVEFQLILNLEGRWRPTEKGEAAFERLTGAE